MSCTVYPLYYLIAAYVFRVIQANTLSTHAQISTVIVTLRLSPERCNGFLCHTSNRCYFFFLSSIWISRLICHIFFHFVPHFHVYILNRYAIGPRSLTLCLTLMRRREENYSVRDARTYKVIHVIDRTLLNTNIFRKLLHSRKIM